MRSFSQWLDYIAGLHAQTIDLGLERITSVQLALDLAQLAPKQILIAGTNGKGSTGKFLSVLAQAHGHSWACYSSPHIIRFTERLVINGCEIAEAKWCEAFAVVEAARDCSLTYFEFTTLAAFYLIRQAGVELAIIEVGLGGRLDATNIIDADVAIITNIARDHEAYLGSDLEVIAKEKCGILRPGQKVVSAADLQLKTITAQAEALACNLYHYQQDFSFSDGVYECQGLGLRFDKLPEPKLLASNIACAVTAFSLLEWGLPEAQIPDLIATTTLTGRLQHLPGPPEIVLDVSHNPASCAQLAAYLATIKQDRPIFAVFSALADKDIAAMLSQVHDYLFSCYCYQLDQPRAASRTQLEQACQAVALTMHWHDSAELALKAALQDVPSNAIMVVFGSFHVVEDFSLLGLFKGEEQGGSKI